MDEDKTISLEDLDDELEEYTFDMNGGAEPEISDNSINLATNSSEAESESESQNKTPETQVASEPETNNRVEEEQNLLILNKIKESIFAYILYCS